MGNEICLVGEGWSGIRVRYWIFMVVSRGGSDRRTYDDVVKRESGNM